MALTETSVIDQLCVDEYGAISVRRADRIYRDDQLINESYHRHVLPRGSDVSGEDPRVQAMAAAMWDSAVEWREAPPPLTIEVPEAPMP